MNQYRLFLSKKKSLKTKVTQIQCLLLVIITFLYRG